MISVLVVRQVLGLEGQNPQVLTLHLCAKELFAQDPPPSRFLGIVLVGSIIPLAVASFQKEPSVRILLGTHRVPIR